MNRLASFHRPKKSGRPRRFETPTEFERESEAFLAECERTGTAPIFPTWAAHMGVSARTLRGYGSRNEYSEVYGRMKTAIESALAQRLFKPGAPVTAILACLNAGFGWRSEPPPDEPLIGDAVGENSAAERIVARLFRYDESEAEPSECGGADD